MKKQYLWISVIFFLLLVAAITVIVIQHRRMEENEALSEYVKEELADQYNEISTQYEGYKLNIDNDSLFAKLESEQMKVQRLQEELRTVKVTNTKRINELTKELQTLRAILRHYVGQIDSLNKVNEQLTQENRQITSRYRQATQTVNALTKEKERLAETVQMAAKLSTSNISVTGLNRKDKPTDKIGKMEKLAFTFTLNGNITAETGEKTIYIRIQNPVDEPLVKSAANLFQFENRSINYSEKRTVEYGGEEMQVSIYYAITETLTPGNYRVDIFADGNRIGQKTFILTK
jgi:DNA repair exonuclease SbcCD ATPase subunit